MGSCLYFQDLLKEVELRTPSYGKLKSTSKSLLDTCAKEPRERPVSDQDVVTHEVKFMGEFWDTTCEKVNDLKQHADNIDRELTVFQEKERTLEDLFDEVENTLQNQKPVSAVPEKCVHEQEVIKVRMSII